MNLHGELAVAEGPLWGEQPTADRDRFSFICGKGVRESVADLLGHSLTAKGGNRGCRAGQLCWTAGQVPLFSIGPNFGANARTLLHWHILSALASYYHVDWIIAKVFHLFHD